MYKNSASFALYPQHDAMFNVEQDLFLLSVVSDKCMQCVTVGDPTNQAWIRRQWNNSISLDATGKNGESELKLLSVVNYYISRCLKQLLLNLILIQIVSSVVALFSFFSNRPERPIWIDCCQIIYRHSQSLHGFHWKTALRRYMLCYPQWSIICTWHWICSCLKDTVQNCSQWLFTRLFSDYNKKILDKTSCSQAPKAAFKLSWNRGCLNDHNYLWGGTSIK